MEGTTPQDNSLFALRSIAIELGCHRDKVTLLTKHELRDIIIKDIHINRILRENDKKTIKKLKRELETLRQVGFKFYAAMKEYN